MLAEERSLRLGRPAVWIAGRCVVLTLIVALAVVFDQPTELGGGGARPLRHLAALGLIYLTSGLYLLADARGARRLALSLLLLDVPIVSAVVHWTGGIDSHFVLVYVPVTAVAGVLHQRLGGVAAAVLSIVAYLVVLVGQGLGWLSPHGYGGVSGRVYSGDAADLVRLTLAILALALTGVVAGHLGRAFAERSRALQTTSRQLVQARLDTAYVVDHLGSGLLSLDERGCILHFNRAAGAIFAVEPAATIGRRPADVLPAGARPFAAWLEWARFGPDLPRRSEVEVEMADGRVVPLGMTGTLTGGEPPASSSAEPQGRGLVVLFQDLTHVRERQAQLARQERLAVIGGLAGGIAHEIRNCVKPISGSLDMLLKELDLDEANRRLMDLAVKECNRLGSFVQDMLDYGRVTPLETKPIRIDRLVDEVADLVQVSKEHGAHRVEVAIALEARAKTADADRALLKQVLLNLALNALESMGEQPGVLRFELALGDPLRPGDQHALHLRVTDTGSGVDSEVRERIFEPFFTTKNGGTGFGLAIAASIVERHGGQMHLESPTAGASFCIVLGQHATVEVDGAA